MGFYTVIPSLGLLKASILLSVMGDSASSFVPLKPIYRYTPFPHWIYSFIATSSSKFYNLQFRATFAGSILPIGQCYSEMQWFASNLAVTLY
jgi:hypothetical protein